MISGDVQPTDADKALAAEAHDWANLLGMPVDASAFDVKLWKAAARTYTTGPSGMAAYIVEGYRRKQSRQAEQAATISRQAAVSAHQGTVGDKVEAPVTVTGVRRFEGSYGARYLHTFEDTAGNVLVWWASVGNYWPGDKITIKGTVKEHTEYKGVAQTVLTRVKVVSVAA